MRSVLRCLLLITLTASAVLFGACIRSRLIVTTEPPGATVTFHHEERGDTPISIPFIWYWYYEVKVEKPGYKPLAEVEFLAPRPWLVMPLDLVMEILPIPIIDNHRRHYVLEPLSDGVAN